MEQQHNLYLELSYKGTGYSGSQLQKNSITIQELLNKAIKKIFHQEEVKTTFSGRTDRGVHAHRQPVNVLVQKKLPVQNVVNGLNSLLPQDIKVKLAEYKPLNFNARFSAKKREYLFNIFFVDQPPLYLTDYVWFIPQNSGPLNISRMQKAAGFLKGRQDFAAFCAAHSSFENKTRTVWKSKFIKQKIKTWPGAKEKEGILLTYRIQADGFLYHMVRNIVSALVDIGRNKLNLQEFKDIIKSKSRVNLKSPTAPANGLVLYKVYY
jgi:tRNA pseudouridine38-40 synthase